MSNLEGLNFYGDPTLDDNIVQNMIAYLRYGLLEIGAFYNITKDQPNHLGANISILTPITGVAGITNYSIYKGIKHDWVWESSIGLKYSNGNQPIQISGIYFNDTFYPTGTQVNGKNFYIDYSRGQVVFDGNQTRNDVVKMAYSVRGVNVYSSDEPEYRLFSSNWREALNTTGTQDIISRAYLPCISVGITNYRTIRGTELGSRRKLTRFNIEFNVFANDSYEQKKLLDTLYMLEEKTIKFFNPTGINFPLNNRGELINSNASYQSNITNYPWVFARFGQDARVIKGIDNKLPFYYGNIQIGLEMDTSPF